MDAADGFELVLRIDDLVDDAVARRLERVELGGARELRLELLMEQQALKLLSIEARLQLLSTNGMRAMTRDTGYRARPPLH